jgi:hypothetical protein
MIKKVLIVPILLIRLNTPKVPNPPGDLQIAPRYE